MSTPALFQPIHIGDITLSHRVVLSPLTRVRNTAEHVPTELGVEYYAQRASVPGTLLVTEGTYISPQAGGQPHAPGIWNDEQIVAWKKISEAVHAKGSYIYLQLWAMGRAARSELLRKENPEFGAVAPSPIPLSTTPNDVPHELTVDEIKDYIRLFGEAAANAVHKAGFDGVELHGANGYLPDQFLQDVTNKRTDAYGGSVENRARFMLEAMEAIVGAVGQKRAALRVSPWNTYNEVRMADPVPQFSYLVEQLKERFPDLAYIHVVSASAMGGEGPKDVSQTHFIRDIWAPRPTITTGGYDRESGIKVAEETGQLVGYGQLFIANPDLPFRLRENVPLNQPDFSTFYSVLSAEGYTTYPFSEEFLKSQKA